MLTGIVADYIMRCHLTLWFGPAAIYPGGWCMCVRKLLKEIVGGYRHKVSQPWLNGEEAFTGDARLVLTDAEHVELGAKAQAITNALAISTAGGLGVYRMRNGLRKCSERASTVVASHAKCSSNRCCCCVLVAESKGALMRKETFCRGAARCIASSWHQHSR